MQTSFNLAPPQSTALPPNTCGSPVQGYQILKPNLCSVTTTTSFRLPSLEQNSAADLGTLLQFIHPRRFLGREPNPLKLQREISNIVSASIPFPPTAPPFPPSPASREERTAGLELGEWIAVAVACAFAVVLILIFVFCYCMVMKKKRIDKANGYLKEGEMQEYEKQLPPGVSTISGPGANFISASTILDEHERRKSISKSRQGSLADGLPGDSYENNNEGRVSRYGVIPPTSFEDSMSHSSGGHAHSDSPVDSRGIPLLPSQDYSGRNYPGMSRRPGPPPPVAPKPNLRERLLALQEQNLSGSRTSVSSDKRIPVSSVRNITQV
ncbi:unnamed protein product [Cyprideis torosa]|uniref:Uncharacterized protein n=1 Tax=Cyprideis torosa TaxID=163714 RepID=A0A7R8ZN88_9CRUS|nr:unnamed protein product [Cyprideis torosa]CAG0887340.1 unnamed protein product [Cyprideis torosa]